MRQQPAPPTVVARRLLMAVAPGSQHPEELADAAQAAYRRLRERLGLVLGQGGFDALWERALRQAQREAGLHDEPADELPRAATDGALHALVRAQDGVATREGLIAVFGACIQLLYTFIGPDLSFRMIQHIWPDVPLGEPQVRGEERT